MKMISRAVVVAVLLFAASSVLGQTKPPARAMNVLVAVATANDAQAALTV